jgi:hypothetical protein
MFWLDVLFGGKGEDVSLTDCATSPDSAEVGVEVTNSSNEVRSYVITVHIVAVEKPLGDGKVFVDDVAPGETTQETGSIAATGKGDACVITSVD